MQKNEETQADRLKKRDAKIKADFEKMHDKRYKGIRVHTYEFCLAKTADKWHLSTSYVRQIINNYVQYKTK